jgi:hypothetical protein
MAMKNIDRKNLRITGAHMAIPDDAQHVEIQDEVIIIVTQAFGPDGDDLVEAATESFDGYPGIPIMVKAGRYQGIVHLSPFHGDPRKLGLDEIPSGTKCELFCPVSGKPLAAAGTVEEGSAANYFAIYLTKRLSDGEMVVISDVSGDHNSRIIDNFELISAWTAGTAS